MIFSLGYFLWLQTEKVTPIVVPLGGGIPPGLLGQQLTVTDPKQGNSGDVEIAIDKTKRPIEISWPEEYSLYSLTLKNLGETEKIDDNTILWSFTTDKPQMRIIPKAGPLTIERTKIEPPVTFEKIINNREITIVILTPGMEFLRRGQRYSIEALFEKEGEDKVYAGLYGFTY